MNVAQRMPYNEDLIAQRIEWNRHAENETAMGRDITSVEHTPDPESAAAVARAWDETFGTAAMPATLLWGE